MAREEFDGISGAVYDVAWCLFRNGPTWDGNLPSKSGRSVLIDEGWVSAHEGWQTLTQKGLIGCIRLGFGDKKEREERKVGRR